MQIVIPMAGDSKRFKEYGFDQPKYLIEVLGKTLLERSLSSLPLHLATKLIFIYKKEHEEKYKVSSQIKNIVCKLFNLINCEVPEIHSVLLDKATRGQAETVLMAKDKLDLEDELIIFNADTQFEYDWSKIDIDPIDDGVTDGLILAVKKEGEQWSFAKRGRNGYVERTTEKERISDNALVGFYHFCEAKDFLESAEARIKMNFLSKGEFYVAPLYNDLIKRRKNFILDIVDSFTPLGTPEEVFDYIKSQSKPTKPRSFNAITIENQTVVKSSKNKFKMGGEYAWLEQMNQHFFLKKYVPAPISLGAVSIKMEQVAAPSLSEIFLYENLTNIQIKKIFDKLFQILVDFRSFCNPPPAAYTEQIVDFYERIYFNKTCERIEQMGKQEIIPTGLGFGSFKVNGKIVNSLSTATIPLKEIKNGLIPAYFHGDYCLPNILYSLEYDVAKLIDPRGELVGDQRYDLAKLRHSFSGYDLIINDYYELKEINDKEFEYTIFWNHNFNKQTSYLFDGMIINYTSLETFRQILIIEALLFLTMIPLHDEDPKRQKMFYILAMEKLNNLSPYESTSI